MYKVEVMQGFIYTKRLLSRQLMKFLEAKKILEQVRGQKLAEDNRIQLANTLAGLILDEAKRTQTTYERTFQQQLASMLSKPEGKLFMTQMSDQCFRSHDDARVADQLDYLIDKWGLPRFIPFLQKLGFASFKLFGRWFPHFFVPQIRKMIRKESSHVILPGESQALSEHLRKRELEKVRVNLNRIGEAILGEEEAKHRLDLYLSDLKRPDIEYISVKISTICSQLNLLAWEETLAILKQRLRELYRTASSHFYQGRPKFVNLDMEEYRDLGLTVEVFKQVLSEPEFQNHYAGIVLQSYLPDSFQIQQELTRWACERYLRNAAPIKIRLVKGANLAMERVEGSLRNWPQAPYLKKSETDANFMRMLHWGFEPDHIKAVHLGVGSHNLFDISYALIFRNENEVEENVSFEMLEGMAESIRRVVQTLANDMLLYCPAASKEQFQNAIAYLVRRLDENTTPENFLSVLFDLKKGSPKWIEQSKKFELSCAERNSVQITPRRTQDRYEQEYKILKKFENEADTDWSLVQNRVWAENIQKKWYSASLPSIPLIIDGEEIYAKSQAKKEDPSTQKHAYSYSLANREEIDRAINAAKLPTGNRERLLKKIAQGLREKRADLIGAMCVDSGKTFPEADAEVSEAVDFAEYYRFSVGEFLSLKDLRWKPKGTILIASPWNFPCSISAGGIIAAIAAGNAVIFKPAPEAVLVGYELAKIFWEAGVSKQVLQFITCRDDPEGNHLIKHPKIDTVVLTGSTNTAKHFLRLKPSLDLYAETGGKNAIIVTSMADQDLAIRDILQSAFGYTGQKCSACSLVILEKEIYESETFLKQFADAAASLKVGSAWDFSTKVNPLITYPNERLKRGLTTLDEGESWLLQPKPDPDNPLLWSPGIKLGVKEGSFTHLTELFGPVLGIMRAENLDDAIRLANTSTYGLTSGLQSLDEREQKKWMEKIITGNGYLNRGITGAIVERQPFGGTKDSSFGKGAKAGGPNYITQLMHAEQLSDPVGAEALPQTLAPLLKDQNLSASELEELKKALQNYTFYQKHYFSKKHDPMHLLGQDNLLSYVPHTVITLRLLGKERLCDVLKVVGACSLTNTPLEISGLCPIPHLNVIEESIPEMLVRVKDRPCLRFRFLDEPDTELAQDLALKGSRNHVGPVLSNGRLELLNYLREVVFSIDYHRYGNLGEREYLVTTRKS